MAHQSDFFNDQHRPAPAADKTRVTAFSCWETCTMCNKVMHSQRHNVKSCRIFRLCEHPFNKGEKCYPWSVICEHVQYPEPEPVLKPESGPLDF